jgi:hypothetical protein
MLAACDEGRSERASGRCLPHHDASRGIAPLSERSTPRDGVEKCSGE